MKIYTRDKFMALPAGTIFAKGKPWVWGTPHIKHDTIIIEGKAIDFVAQDLVGIDAHDSGELFARMEEMLQTGCSYPLEDAAGRDGCFDDEDLFLVYEWFDLQQLIGYLHNAASVAQQEARK